MAEKIGIFSQDIEFHILTRFVLTKGGYSSFTLRDAATGLDIVEEPALLAVIVDCRRTDNVGLAMCTAIKQNSKVESTPVLAIVERASESLYLQLAELGIEAIFYRPFEPTEIIDFLNGLVRRGEAPIGGTLHFASIRLDVIRRKAFFNDRQLNLGETQYLLLKTFIREPGRVFRREQLIEAAWPSGTFVDDRTVDVHVGVLRKILRQAGAPDIVRTVRGAGYTVDVEWDWQ